MPARAVSILSGGLDSVCYSAILGRQFDLYLVTFSYGQRAIEEISCAMHFSKILHAKEHQVIDIDFMKSIYGSTNVLTGAGRKIPGKFSQSLVVPIRNAVFITIATAWAMSTGAEVVAYGAHKDDLASYPDCRPAFARSLLKALNLAEEDAISSGIRRKVVPMSPAMQGMGKADLLRSGYRLLGDEIFQTWSCYTEGVGKRRIHCGRCESCINRKVAFISAGVEDKTIYAESGSGSGHGKAKRDIHEH